MQVSALEHCKKLAWEKSYFIELFQDGWKPSVKEERKFCTEHELVDPLQQKQSPCSGLTEGLHPSCISSLPQASCNALKHWLAFFPLATWIFMKHLCSYLLNIFLGWYYLLNVRNRECIHKNTYFETFSITVLYNKDCSVMYYKITIVITRISDLPTVLPLLIECLSMYLLKWNLN